jgi:hypothetical protein
LETAISMQLKKVRLELARAAGSPSGNPNDGYEFVAPLDDKAGLDAEVWPEAGQLCTMRRFAPGAEDVHGGNADEGWSAAFITTTFGSSFRWAEGLLRGGQK